VNKKITAIILKVLNCTLYEIDNKNGDQVDILATVYRMLDEKEQEMPKLKARIEISEAILNYSDKSLYIIVLPLPGKLLLGA
jgi:hypothetical protein